MEEPTNKILEWLMPKGHGEEDLKLKVVSVLGDEGAGKSTLVKRIWRLSKGKFDCQAFVQTAKKPDTRMILRSILSQVRPKQPLKVCKVPKLVTDLREHLQDKRYFIVIDGLWDVSVWHIIKRAFPAGNQRIITTTAVENVAHVCCSYDSNSIVNVECLGTDQAKNLFIDRAFGSEKGCPPQFNDFTDEITRKCGGFPLAIICTARLVASQPETEQEQQLDYVTKFLPNNLSTHSSSMEILNQVLKLCYSSLPHYLKTCLLYLSVYPENYLLLKEDLVKQWIAEDFICTPEGKDIVDVAGSYFDELLSLGLIQRIDIVNSYRKGLLCYTVHPVVFDFITCKSMEDNFITIIDYSQSTVVLSEKVRRLALHFGSATYATTPESVELSQVRSLSFIGLLDCMPSIAEFKLVRVMMLHICSDDVDTRFSLSEICNLLQLRYLQVRCNVTVELPKQMCLKHLETLEINAVVENVPSDIVHLSRLRHVRLGEKTNRTPGQMVSVKVTPSVYWRRWRLPSLSIPLRSFELLHPICMFPRLPRWFRQLHKLRRMEIVVRQLSADIDVLAELPVLKHLSLYVRTPPNLAIIFSRGMFPALEYFKFACGVLSLGFQKGTLPNLRWLKLVFNAHKREQYGIPVGISHLLSLQKVVAGIGLAPGAGESDRIAAGSAFKDAIRQHQCHRSFEVVVKRVDQVDEDWNQQEGSSNERGQVPLWKLAFRTPPQLPVFTGSKIEDEAGNPLEVILVDAGTGSPAVLPQALRVELVPVFGDFPPEGREDWSADEFHRNVVKERHGKGPLLTGDVSLTMRDGRATVGELQFTDNSSWVRCRMFRIGARVVPASYDGGRIVEAITEAFMVRDHRGDLFRKHYPPVLGDSVWRLKNIGKEGAIHRKLRHNNIETVQEFLRMLAVKPDELRAILGDGMTDHMWEVTTSHARTCVPGDEVYVYTAGGSTIYVNSVFNLVKVKIGGTECTLQQLNRDKSMLLRQLILEAYEHRYNLIELETRYPPSLGHSAWVLENIAKEGAFHNRLEHNNIKTVQDFIRMLMVKPDELRAILGDGMTDRMWEETSRHARTCVPGDKVYVYAADGGTIYVNSVFNLVKVEIGGTECTLQQLNRDKSMLLRQLILEAYEHRYNLIELETRYPPSLGHSAWVLENIAKEGAFHNRLEHNNIKTVQDFIRMLMVKPDELRAILGDGMTDRMWEETSRHARTCVPGDKVYVYAADGGTIYVNSVFNLVKVEIGGIECPLEQLNWDQMALVLLLIMEAYKHRHDLEETSEVTFDGDATDNIALLRARFAAHSRADMRPVINNLVPNPWIIQ
ncbi:disease resistance protein RGA5-like isoform X2 [Miscanthus floridulus]